MVSEIQEDVKSKSEKRLFSSHQVMACPLKVGTSVLKRTEEENARFRYRPPEHMNSVYCYCDGDAFQATPLSWMREGERQDPRSTSGGLGLGLRKM